MLCTSWSYVHSEHPLLRVLSGYTGNVGRERSRGVFTSELKGASSSAPRVTSAHSHSARKVRFHSNQTQLLREAGAMVRARGGNPSRVDRGPQEVLDEFHSRCR